MGTCVCPAHEGVNTPVRSLDCAGGLRLGSDEGGGQGWGKHQLKVCRVRVGEWGAFCGLSPQARVGCGQPLCGRVRTGWRSHSTAHQDIMQPCQRRQAGDGIPECPQVHTSSQGQVCTHTPVLLSSLDVCLNV